MLCDFESFDEGMHLPQQWVVDLCDFSVLGRWDPISKEQVDYFFAKIKLSTSKKNCFPMTGFQSGNLNETWSIVLTLWITHLKHHFLMAAWIFTSLKLLTTRSFHMGYVTCFQYLWFSDYIVLVNKRTRNAWLSLGLTSKILLVRQECPLKKLWKFCLQKRHSKIRPWLYLKIIIICKYSLD